MANVAVKVLKAIKGMYVHTWHRYVVSIICRVEIIYRMEWKKVGETPYERMHSYSSKEGKECQ